MYLCYLICKYINAYFISDLSARGVAYPNFNPSFVMSEHTKTNNICTGKASNKIGTVSINIGAFLYYKILLILHIISY